MSQRYQWSLTQERNAKLCLTHCYLLRQKSEPIDVKNTSSNEELNRNRGPGCHVENQQTT